MAVLYLPLISILIVTSIKKACPRQDRRINHPFQTKCFFPARRKSLSGLFPQPGLQHQPGPVWVHKNITLYDKRNEREYIISIFKWFQVDCCEHLFLPFRLLSFEEPFYDEKASAFSDKYNTIPLSVWQLNRRFNCQYFILFHRYTSIN